MILEVITPDEVLFKGNVSQVILPGLDGTFGILNDHAPLISALVKGNVRVDQNIEENINNKAFNGVLNKEHKDDSQFSFEINGGVIEVFDNKILVLAE
ncbi:MAG TPA: F0F1 ATP synthase subunit epsilon [Crocinitomix sp.]|nr:F0F1 ATP synthase subunit epsilon [Crocinitomix sp.]